MKEEREKKLSDVYPERTVKTGEFTWFSNFGRPAISTVIGVSGASDEFMSMAFGFDEVGSGHQPKHEP